MNNGNINQKIDRSLIEHTKEKTPQFLKVPQKIGEPNSDKENKHNSESSEAVAKSQLSQKIDSPITDQPPKTNEGRSSEAVALIAKTNRQYVSDAKKMQVETPDIKSAI